jgi:glucokinase
MTTLREQTYVSKNFADLVPIVHEFFKEAAKASVNIPSVASACFGIAGAVVHNASELANLSWTLSGERLQRALEILRVTLINDFAAIGYGIAGLRDEQLATRQAGTPDAAAGGFHEGLFQQGRACAP